MAHERALSTGKLPLGGLLRNSVVRITRHPDMNLVVDCEHKLSNNSTNQPNKQKSLNLHTFYGTSQDLQYGNVLNALRKLASFYSCSHNHICQ